VDNLWNRARINMGRWKKSSLADYRVDN